jgi:hypothetical protein
MKGQVICICTGVHGNQDSAAKVILVISAFACILDLNDDYRL